MKIGILGAGRVGSSLGGGWIKAGHAVMFGVRDPQSGSGQRARETFGDSAQISTMHETAAFGEIVVLAIPWAAVHEILGDLGDTLDGKVLVDATNRFGPAQPGDGPSAGEDVAKMVPRAKLVKAFNTMSAETMANPDFDGEAMTAFICGDDAEAKATVMQLARDLGMDAAEIGPLSNAGLQESLTMLWFNLTRTYGRESGFRFLRR